MKGRYIKGTKRLRTSHAQTLAAGQTPQPTGGLLAEQIQYANLIPNEVSLPDELFNIYDRFSKGLEAWPSLKEIESIILQLPSGLADFLLAKLHDEKIAKLDENVIVLYTNVVYSNVKKSRELLGQIVQMNKTEKIQLVRACPNCALFFMATREDQNYCRDCGKKMRDKRWRTNYKQKHGENYRPRTREPRHVVKVRQVLHSWDRKDEKDLAALADITRNQALDALNYIERIEKRASNRLNG